MTVTVKGALGAIPGLGGPLAEIDSQFIPQQRVERLEVYARGLTARLDDLEEAWLWERLEDPERIDLFEEGAPRVTEEFLQAAYKTRNACLPARVCYQNAICRLAGQA